MYLHLTSISNQMCDNVWSQISTTKYKIFPTNFCTSTPFGSGTCKGDSGSPVVLFGELVGITSFGMPCAKGVPDVFERISSHKEWIDGIIKQ